MNPLHPIRFLFLIAILACAPPGYEGRVVKVIDGDTFDITTGHQKKRIRMYGIDSPEQGQAYNVKAREFTMSLIAGKNVQIVERNKDRYGRTVADVYLSDGTHVNALVVKAGYAWHFKRYSKSTALAAFEAAARQARRGLWQDNQPVAPWDFRKKK